MKARHQFVTKTRLFSVCFADVDGRKARKLKGFRLRTTKLNGATSRMKKVVMSVFENISTPNLNDRETRATD